MTKTDKLPVTTSKNQVALAHDYGEDAGVGLDLSFDDLIMPFAKLLQQLSPELKKNKPEFNELAQEGDIYNPATKQIFKELLIVPAAKDSCYLEFLPKRGGFVARHAVTSPVVLKAKATAEDKFHLKTPTGNELVETRSIYAVVLDPETQEPIDVLVLSFSSTKIRELQEYWTLVNSCKVTKKVPIFANLVKVTVVDRENKKGDTWKGFKLSPATGEVVTSLIAPDSLPYQAAKKLAGAITAGTAKADYSQAETTETSSGDEHY